MSFKKRRKKNNIDRRISAVHPILVNKIFLSVLLFTLQFTAGAQPFHLPTANQALFEKGGEERFFVPTPGKPWTSGCFGCVRSGGWQMHEGLDIKCLQRDRHGEPTDPVMATDDGTVMYMNDKPSLSNYGRYIVVRHIVDGVEVYSLYAHLSAFVPGLRPGQAVKTGEKIAVMGRTSNTRSGISKERAHVHFELNLFYNDHFSAWYRKHYPRERDDHGIWNGQNLVGFDPRLIFLAEHEEGSNFNLVNWLRHRTEICRVQVRKADFSWPRRYPMLVNNSASVPAREIAGYEMALDFNGLPFELIPRTASQMKGSAKYELISVNEAEYAKNPCRRLVTRRGSHWQLATDGINLLDLITY
jgi:murein DD-endopeptidase MepM/ murein hydrolase activator NlpD